MRKTHVHWLYAVAIAALGVSSVTRADAVADEKEARAAIAAWAATRASFPHIKCRFTYTDGAARTEADALAGQWIAKSQPREMIWIVDGRRILHKELAATPKSEAVEKAVKSALAKAKSGGSRLADVSLPPTSQSYMSDGDYQFKYLPFMSVANVFTPELPGLGADTTPFSYNAMGQEENSSPPALLAATDSGRGYFKPEGRRVIDGVPVVSMAWGHRGKVPNCRYHFDTQRGHLPLQIESIDNRDGRLIARIFLTSVRECSRGRLFPERIVDVEYPTKPSAPCSVSEIKVLELDVDNRPSPDDFVVLVAAGTQVHNPVDMKSHFYTKQDERISIDDLPKLAEKCKNAKSTPRMDTAIQAPPAKRGWLLWVGGAALGVLLLWAGYLIRNRFVRTAAGA